MSTGVKGEVKGRNTYNFCHPAPKGIIPGKKKKKKKVTKGAVSGKCSEVAGMHCPVLRPPRSIIVR